MDILYHEKIEKIIAENPSEHDLLRASEDQKILTMVQDGIVKVVNGVTTLEEVKRVVDLS